MAEARKDPFGWLGIGGAVVYLLSPLLYEELPAYGILSGIAILALCAGIIAPIVAAVRSSKWWLLVTFGVLTSAFWLHWIHQH